MKYDTTTKSDFEVNIKIGTSEITINTGDVSDIATKGFHFELQEGQTVEFGKLKDLIAWLNKEFKAKLPEEADEGWPEGIKDLLNGILGTKVSLKRLKIDQDKQDKDKDFPPVKLDVSVNAKPSGGDVYLIPGLLVNSVAIGFKRDYKEKDGAPPTRGALTKKRR